MMSGHNVPYQLRTNKFVERQLFLDVLDFVRIWNGPAEYVYVSMGGRFLEDFKHINARFAIEHMVSLESDSQTCLRQLFNVPIGFVECKECTTGEFITDYESFAAQHDGRRSVVWLDYASANKRQEQLQEYEQLVGKLASGDVIKITLNANFQSTKKRARYRGHKRGGYEALVVKDLKEQLDGYLPAGGITSEHLQGERFAALLAECVRIAAIRSTELSGLTAVPLMSCRYSDSRHQMLTVTSILADDALRKAVAADKRFELWPFRSREWDAVHEIKVPDLSLKERHWLNERIKADADPTEIHDSIGFLFDDAVSESKKLLKNYIMHYRRYPTFHWVPH